MYKVTCDGKYPTLNEYIKNMNRNKYSGNNFKKQYQHICMAYIARDLHALHIDSPVIIKYRFYEANKKRDLDNIAGFFHKVFQDALTARGVLVNDGWAQIIGYEDRFFIDKERPRVEIEIVTEQGSGKAENRRKKYHYERL